MRRRPGPFSNYVLIDFLVQGYLVLVGLLVLLFRGDSVHGWQWLAAGHAAAVVGLHLFLRRVSVQRGGFLGLLRTLYAVPLYIPFYLETHLLDQMFMSGSLDGFFIDLEQRIFAEQLSRTLMASMPHLWVSEPMYLFYFSYYPMVLFTGVALYFIDRRRVLHYVTVASLTFYFCYLFYIFFPVMGPYGTTAGVTFAGRLASVGPRTVPAALQRGLFYKVVALIYLLVEPQGGAAFPSSHVAVAVVTLWFGWRFFGWVRWAHLLAVVMLCLSTVYCGFHYAVDVLGGLATAAFTVPVAEVLYRRWGEGAAATAVQGASPMPRSCPRR